MGAMTKIIPVTNNLVCDVLCRFMYTNQIIDWVRFVLVNSTFATDSVLSINGAIRLNVFAINTGCRG